MCMEVACYCRVSTEDQNLDRQLEKTANYAEDQLRVGVDEIEVYRDKSTGTDTKRDGYQQMMADVETFDAVVVSSISRVSRSIRDLDTTVDKLSERDTQLHIIDESLVIKPDDEDPFQRAVLQLLGVFAELEASMTQARVAEGLASRMDQDEYHHGRAPIGFDKDDGRLIENEQYHDVSATLEMVQKDNLSKRKAAERLGCARKTVNRALDRSELYGL